MSTLKLFNKSKSQVLLKWIFEMSFWNERFWNEFLHINTSLFLWCMSKSIYRVASFCHGLIPPGAKVAKATWLWELYHKPLILPCPINSTSCSGEVQWSLCLLGLWIHANRRGHGVEGSMCSKHCQMSWSRYKNVLQYN